MSGGTTGPPPAGLTYVNTLSVTAGTDLVILNTNNQIDAERLLGPLLANPNRVQKAGLIAALEYRIDWENRYFVEPAKRVRDTETKMPISLFMYQGAMEAVGDGPKYFLPASLISRTIAFFHSLVKFAYFGMFITVLSKRWTKQGQGHRSSGVTQSTDSP